MRLITLLLSITTIVLYGYALAGLGSYLLGTPRMDLIIEGLAGGTATAAAAILVWKRYLNDLESELKTTDESRPH